MANENLLTLTADIIAAHVQNNKLAASELPVAISSVYDALAQLGTPAAAPAAEAPTPAVSVRSSVKADAITCLDCGKKQKTLKRHLATAHDLTPDQYRTKWNLPPSYPMVAADYAALRADLAKKIGLGRKPGQKMPAKAGARKRAK